MTLRTVYLYVGALTRLVTFLHAKPWDFMARS